MKCKSIYCDRDSVARGLCKKHHRRWMKGENINNKNILELAAKERLFLKITKNPTSKCWLWTGNTRGRGLYKYGIIDFKYKRYSAHRFSWIVFNGEIPKGGDYRGMCVSHKCDNTLCVNPKHLFLATHQQNMQDKVRKGRDTNKEKLFCKHGHMRTQENIYICKNGLKHCRTCARQRERKRRSRLKVSLPPDKKCTFKGCISYTKSKYGLCVKHYKLQYNRVARGIINNIQEKKEKLSC